MVKTKILNIIKNNIKAGFKRFQNEKVKDQILQILSLLTGIGIAWALNNSVPMAFSLDFFYFFLGLTIVFVIVSWLTESFTIIRILLIGASIVSVLSALLTWVSTGKNGFISIDLNQIDGIFRSILLTSFFSLLERITRFIEDRVEAKKT
jgi:hypothetical protein